MVFPNKRRKLEKICYKERERGENEIKFCNKRMKDITDTA